MRHFPNWFHPWTFPFWAVQWSQRAVFCHSVKTPHPMVLILFSFLQLFAIVKTPRLMVFSVLFLVLFSWWILRWKLNDLCWASWLLPYNRVDASPFAMPTKNAIKPVIHGLYMVCGACFNKSSSVGCTCSAVPIAIKPFIHRLNMFWRITIRLNRVTFLPGTT